MKDESPSESLETLISRLRAAAATLDVDQPPIAPPIGDWHRKLAELRDQKDEQALLPDAQRQALAEVANRAAPSHGQGAPAAAERACHQPGGGPAAPASIAVLMASHRDDAAFVNGLFQRLLGRAGDADGTTYYRRQLAAHGRLYVLGEFLQSPEADAAMASQPKRVVEELQRIRDTWQQHQRGGRLAPYWLDMRWRLRAARCRARWRLEALEAQQQEQREATATLYADLGQLAATLLRVNEALDSRLEDWHAERHELATAVLEMDDRQRHFGARQDHEHAARRVLWEQLALLRRQRLSAGAPAQATSDAARVAPPAEPSAAELDAYYLAFEEAFRGPEADIAAHLQGYRDVWARARQAGARALDLGCGRGEWLRLLAQAGFTPRGIDLNATMVAHCRAQGFEVEHQDALAALRQAQSGSLALVSGFHIAEHLSFEALFALVAEAHRVLAPGGVLILETPNPENLIVASYSFYHDLTHRHPLTPVTFQFLLQFHGFGDAVVRRFNPPPDDTRVPGEGPVVERLNAMLAAPMDYAVIGTRGQASPGEGA